MLDSLLMLLDEETFLPVFYRFLATQKYAVKISEVNFILYSFQDLELFVYLKRISLKIRHKELNNNCYQRKKFLSSSPP